MPTTDAASWRELYFREYPRLLRALLAMGGDSDAAEDAAQEAFVRAYSYGLDRIETPRAWLLVVGSRELFKQRRRLARQESLTDLERSAPSGAFEAVAERAELLGALRRLPERQRSVVVARFYYGLSYEEIAEAFEIKSGTVGATLHQALQTLRQWQLAAQLAAFRSRGPLPQERPDS
jgi:RNA polymerase sigma factor (sigma-70 family)